MNIAFILSGNTITSTNGVISQAKTWKKGLSKQGHKVTLVNMWEPNNWSNFSAIIYFGFNTSITSHIDCISKINPNIYLAPILDPDYSVLRLKLYKNWGIKYLNLTNQYHSLNLVKSKIKCFLVRSNFEKHYITKGFNINECKCKVVPLSFNYSNISENEQIEIQKEDFCLHVSLLADERKNVKRLIEAAKKYKFKLVLGGKLRNEDELQKIKTWIGNHQNISYVGFLSNEELLSLYKRAKVFALPSTNEGVGIVGLEAAAQNCDIVLTSYGGPKEYYDKYAKIVNPYSIDDIGLAIKSMLDGKTFQPDLKNHIIRNYNLDKISQILECALSCT